METPTLHPMPGLNTPSAETPVTPVPAPDTSGAAPKSGDATPRWVLGVGIALLLLMMAAGAFSLGVFVAERSLLH